MSEWYDKGRSAYYRLVTSRQFSWVDPEVNAAAAIKIFWPPTNEGEMRIQMARPLDKDRAEWMRGFEDEKGEAHD